MAPMLDGVLARLNELRDRFHGELEAVVRYVTEEIERAGTASGDRLVGPDEACELSGYSKRQLRRLVAERRLTNHGRPRAPLYRVGELPMKAGHRTGPDTGASAPGLETGLREVYPRPSRSPAASAASQPTSPPPVRRGRDAAIEARAREKASRPRRSRTVLPGALPGV